MKRPEGWRSNRPVGVPLPAYQAVPQYEAVTPVAEALPPESAGATRARASAIWRYLVAARSRLTAVEWSMSFIGVLGFLFATTTYRLPIGTASMIIGILGLFLLPGGFRFTTSAGIFSAFLVWAAAGAVFSPWRGVAFEAWLEVGKVFLIYLVMVNALRSRAQIWFFMVFFLALFGSHPVRGTIINYLTGNTYFGRAAWYQGIFGNANDMAALTLLQLSMAAALLMTERKGIVKLGALFAIVVMPFTILVTQSRAVLLSLGVFVVVALWTHPRRARIFGAIAVIGVLLVAISPEGVWERIKGLRYATSTETLGSVDEEGSATQRWAIWQAGLRVIKAHPVAGTGLDTYKYANGSVSAALGDRDAHSTYITLAAENGVPGLILFLVLVGATIVQAEAVRRRVRRVTPDGAMQLRFLELGLICFLLAGIFGSYSKLTFLYVHLALIWALAAACEREAAEARRMVLMPGRGRSR